MSRPDAIRVVVRPLALVVLVLCLLTAMSRTPNAQATTECPGSPFQCYQAGHFYYLDPETCTCMCSQAVGNGACEQPREIEQETCTCVLPDVCQAFRRKSPIFLGVMPGLTSRLRGSRATFGVVIPNI